MGCLYVPDTPLFPGCIIVIYLTLILTVAGVHLVTISITSPYTGAIIIIFVFFLFGAWIIRGAREYMKVLEVDKTTLGEHRDKGR
jgi:hypothetical protein